MLRYLRHAVGFASDLGAYGWRTGRWWLPAVAVLLVVASALALTTTKVVVPVMLYTLV